MKKSSGGCDEEYERNRPIHEENFCPDRGLVSIDCLEYDKLKEAACRQLSR